ncbi:Isoprenylcysteine carboxyl methyltransferase [Spraguea lophii 42_110]|uniref:Protein-S-isoprenylcysteine O-methyltransferase n=1 Tax=Spraguea lophii (strain 42_110) TaxID=1358809 RepID=S7WE76_SPRLO|nr:Isoprenylcysteine carboxyl methyltransferase [Spraguea lophii 42_110]
MDIGLKYFFLGLLFGSKYYLSNIINILVIFLFFYTFFKCKITLIEYNNIGIMVVMAIIEHIFTDIIIKSIFYKITIFRILLHSRIFKGLYFIYNLMIVSIIFISLLSAIYSMYNTYNSTELVVTGLYGYVRHPLYLSLFILISFILVKIHSFISLIFFIYNSKYIHSKIKEEEDELCNKFNGYKKYKGEVPYGLFNINDYI